MIQPSIMGSEITIRRILPEEWELLRPIYSSQGDKLPPPEGHEAIIALHKGQIVGLFGINAIVHAGPLWVASEFRRMGIALRMGRALDERAKELGIEGYLMFPSTLGSLGVAKKLGLKPRDWRVFERTLSAV